MKRVSSPIRLALVAALTATGAYLAFVGVSVLANVGDVTDRWTRLSGDPDFPADAPRLAIVIGAGAALWLIVGGGAVYAGIRAFAGQHVRRSAIIALALTATLAQFAWLVYRHMGTGSLPRPEAAEQYQAALRQAIVMTSIYLAGAIALWTGTARRNRFAPAGRPTHYHRHA